jgi:hypothetical protein
LVNSCARSTLLISSAPARIVPTPPAPGALICTGPEFVEATYAESPAFSRPAGLVKFASAT